MEIRNDPKSRFSGIDHCKIDPERSRTPNFTLPEHQKRKKEIKNDDFYPQRWTLSIERVFNQVWGSILVDLGHILVNLGFILD